LPFTKVDVMPSLAEHLVDHRAAAMDDDGVHADLAQQHDVPREAGHGGVVAHGVAAELDHHDRVVVALQVGERLAQRAGGGD
jgi:hypothetical protein